MQSQLAASCQNSSSNLANTLPEQDEAPRFSGAPIQQAPAYFRKKMLGPDNFFVRRKGGKENSRNAGFMSLFLGGGFLAACFLSFGAFKTGQIQKALDCSLGKALKHFFQGRWNPQSTGFSRRAETPWQNRTREQELQNDATRARNDATFWRTRYQSSSEEVTRLRRQIRDLESPNEELEGLRTQLNQRAVAQTQSERVLQQLRGELREAQAALRESRNELRQLREQADTEIPESTEIRTAREAFESHLEQRIQSKRLLNLAYNTRSQIQSLEEARTQLRIASDTLNTRRSFGTFGAQDTIREAEESERNAQQTVTRLQNEINNPDMTRAQADRGLENARTELYTQQRELVRVEEAAIRIRQEAISRGDTIRHYVPLNLLTPDELKNWATTDADYFREKLLQFPDPMDKARILLRADVHLSGLTLNSRGVIYNFDSDNPIFRSGEENVQFYSEFDIDKVNRPYTFGFDNAQRRRQISELLHELRSQKIMPDYVRADQFRLDASTACSWPLRSP